MTDLDSLIEELEKATEDNQHIVLYDAIKFARKQGWLSEDQEAQAWVWRNVEAYLHVALTLVPEGVYWSIESAHKGLLSDIRPTATLWTKPDLSDEVMYFAATSALALCIAALRARQEMAEESHAQGYSEHSQG